jgi:hypothetical protein
VKDIAREHPRDTIVLITANNKQFGGLPEGLRPELAAEVTNEGLKIGFFGSLDDFLRAHADKIDFITGEWLQQSIRSQDLLTTFRCRNDGGRQPGMRSGRRSLISSARFTYSVLHPVQVVVHGVRRCAARLGRGPSDCWRSRRARPSAASRRIRGTDSAAAHDIA